MMDRYVSDAADVAGDEEVAIGRCNRRHMRRCWVILRSEAKDR